MKRISLRIDEGLAEILEKDRGTLSQSAYISFLIANNKVGVVEKDKEEKDHVQRETKVIKEDGLFSTWCYSCNSLRVFKKNKCSNCGKQI